MKACAVSPSLVITMLLMLNDSSDMCSEPNPADNLTCTVNFIDDMHCTLKTGPHAGDGPFLLTIEHYFIKKNCTLLKMPKDENTFGCHITGVDGDEDYEFEITVKDNNTLINSQTFIPRCNIKLYPPVNLSNTFNGSIYKITWSGYRGHDLEYYGSANLHYELQFKKEDSSWPGEISKHKYDSDNTETLVSMELQSSEFESGSRYDVRVRSKTYDTVNTGYRSQWSDWSQEMKIINLEKNESQISLGYILVVICPLVTTFIMLYLVLCSSLSARFKIPFLKEVPTAAKFFQPLYILHNGNFQDWTKYPNKCVQRRKEEPSCSSVGFSFHNSAILNLQKETISPVNTEAREVKEAMPWSDLLRYKEITLSELYPSSTPDFPMCNEEEANQDLSRVDYSTEYVSYNGVYIVNSSERLG
ncbi:interleukin-21 receptor-like isoform X2 [Hyperolius riggenbachi]|uniref:interleukin-21 receptor-like isoform X2 n=1 Tax=Hyperolius riggenbachi TaxID=752182 RepID=UPI0035A29B59